MRKSGFIVVIDAYLVRKGMLSLLKQISGVAILKEASDMESLTTFLPGYSVDFLIISQSLFDASADIFTQNPALLEKVILLKDGKDEAAKGADTRDLTHSSIYLADDKEHIVRRIQDLIDQDDSGNKGPSSASLSPRETTIVRLVSMGLTNRQIADKLFLSAHTVMTHRKNISTKLGIKSVSGLTVYAIVNNIITIEEVTSLPAE
jgi:DNA-binding NarL/FixJ family response regulator